MDGFAIVQDAATDYWHFATLGASGELEALSERPGIETAPGEIERHLRPLPTSESVRVAQERSLSRTAAFLAPKEEAVPSTGTGNVPVFLINFSNTASTYTAAQFNTLLFGTGNFSMKDYYSEVSYGAFTVSAGPGGVVGWYTAANTHDYYGTNVSGDDAWPGDLVYEAAVAANTAGFNFAPYDQDGDCYVDNLMVVHQGGGRGVLRCLHDEYLVPFVGPELGAVLRSALALRSTDNQLQLHGQPRTEGQGQQVHDPARALRHHHAHHHGGCLLPRIRPRPGSPRPLRHGWTSEGVGDWSLMAGGSWGARSEATAETARSTSIPGASGPSLGSRRRI